MYDCKEKGAIPIGMTPIFNLLNYTNKLLPICSK